MVTPANIVDGALVSQVSIVFIMTVAAFIIRRDWRLTRWIHEMPTYSGFRLQILVLLLVAIAALALSEELDATWRPLFGALGFRSSS
jgi:hypothetical protein